MSAAAPRPAPRTAGRPSPWRRWRWVVLALLVVVVAALVWFLVSLRTLQPAVAALRSDVTTLQRQLQSGELGDAGTTLTKVRADASDVRSSTSGPVWAVAAHLPAVGRDFQAVRTVAHVGSAVTTAAQPLETALPALSASAVKADGGAIDTAAVSRIAEAIPAITAAVQEGAGQLDDIDTDGLNGTVAGGVEQVRTPLRAAVGPLLSAANLAPHLPSMIGAEGKKTYFVMLQQDAEARGTGGLMGAYALVSFDQGKLSLEATAPRGVLQNVPIPSTTVAPQELQDLWNTDLDEWAGLNLSPNFPWTGQLVNAGWKARDGQPAIDGVLGIDANVVAALLAGTGPVSSGGLELTSDNAVGQLGRDIYARYPDPDQVDAATGEIVKSVFSKLASGDFDLGTLVRAMKKPYSERRLVMWSSDASEEQALTSLTLGGSIPDAAGPFAMTVVNNGGGNKLDAYLKVATAFDPGTCTGGVRVGTMTVTLTNSAPSSGLPDYVTVRSDLKEAGKTNPVVGSNRVLVDLYTAVGSDVPLVQQGGEDVPIVVSGVDRGHTVTRVAVVVNPGQQISLTATVVDAATTTPGSVVTMTQPMFKPQTISAKPVSACAS